MDKGKKKQIRKLEKDIQEEQQLWPDIQKIPEKDSGFIALLKRLLRPHRGKPVTSNSKAKAESELLFGGIEPPSKKGAK